jgi:hypothetical protein
MKTTRGRIGMIPAVPGSAQVAVKYRLAGQPAGQRGVPIRHTVWWRQVVEDGLQSLLSVLSRSTLQ